MDPIGPTWWQVLLLLLAPALAGYYRSFGAHLPGHRETPSAERPAPRLEGDI